MGDARTILVKPIDPATANALVRRVHYSGKVTQNSQLHLGVFYEGRLEGAMQFGPSIDKRRMLGLVEGTAWNGYLELNRLAFTDNLPRNSESRALGVALRMFRKHRPDIEWIVSFADATQCGDGAIYRAAGFVLTGIKRNTGQLLMGGRVVARKSLDDHRTGGRYLSAVLKERGVATPAPGFQLRYVYFLNPEARERLTVPEIPFAAIREAGASMYRGKRAESIDSDAPDLRSGEGGARPTSALQTLQAVRA